MIFSDKFYAKLLGLFISSRPKLNVTTKTYNQISTILEKKNCDVFISDSLMMCPMYSFEVLKAVEFINGMKNLKYIKDKRDCDDYATYLRAMMRLTYQNIAFGECWVKIGDYDHAMNFFIDKDGKINYLEPQTNRLVSSRGVKPYLMIV